MSGKIATNLSSRIRSRINGFIGLFIQNRMGALGLVLLVTTVTPVILAPLFARYAPDAFHYAQTLQSPSLTYLFGTDNYGRSIFSRVLYGGRRSLFISLVGVTIATTFGTAIGVTAGYYGGRYDEVIMRLIDTSMAFPVYVLAILLTTIIQQEMLGVIVAIGFVFTPNFARISRGSTLSVKEKEFVEASQAMGFSDLKIMSSDILPNAIAPLIIQMAISAGYGIIVEAGLSFLGLGIEQVSWGIILAESRNFIAEAPWAITLPGIYMTILILSFNLIGDAVRDQLDPELSDEIEVKQ